MDTTRFTSSIQDLYYLWKPVFPFLALHVREVFDRNIGNVLEVGPFCGLAGSLQALGIGDSFSMAPFPEDIARFFADVSARDMTKVTIIPTTDGTLENVPSEYADLVIFRGAFFFPAFFDTDFRALWRILKPRGIAFVGGGFGAYTPREEIDKIWERSKTLNDMVGKITIEPATITKHLARVSRGGDCEISRDGGLWVIMRKKET